jgi:predicted AAA+ superfamily ATPase
VKSGREGALTGSQKFTLMKGVSESLAGRADIVELETLSLAEIRGALPRTRPETAVVRGGFPELHAGPEIDFVAQAGSREGARNPGRSTISNDGANARHKREAPR